MALTVETIDLWREYLKGVMNRANHHAQNVNEIALALIGAIIWRSTDEVKVMEREGEAKNILWMCIIGKNFCRDFCSGPVKIKVSRSRVPKQLSCKRILGSTFQNVLHCLLIKTKT